MGKTWRQERTHYAQTDIDRHLYLLPRDVQQRHHNQAPEHLQAASGRPPGGRDTWDRTANKILHLLADGYGPYWLHLEVRADARLTPSIPFSVTSGSNAVGI